LAAPSARPSSTPTSLSGYSGRTVYVNTVSLNRSS